MGRGIFQFHTKRIEINNKGVVFMNNEETILSKTVHGLTISEVDDFLNINYEIKPAKIYLLSFLEYEYIYYTL